VNTGGKSLQANGLSIVTLLLFFGIGNVAAEDVFTWPDGQKMAISLSYDDALDSQLDNAIPSLNKHGLVASFYLTLASPTVRHRLEEWRAAAVQGHELGNHTIFHPCSAALPDRDWVPSYYNLDDYVIQEIVDLVSGENYLPEVRGLFVAVKGFESNDKTFANWWGAVGVSGSELIERIEIESASGTKLFNIIFHGIGGDYLTVTSEAHNYLLDYLVDKRETYWVDSYINIMKYASDNSAFEDVR
jgi:peptidoglycan/xylan/chitin deacetylase (PgdA/CDA1 family)